MKRAYRWLLVIAMFAVYWALTAYSGAQGGTPALRSLSDADLESEFRDLYGARSVHQILEHYPNEQLELELLKEFARRNKDEDASSPLDVLRKEHTDLAGLRGYFYYAFFFRLSGLQLESKLHEVYRPPGRLKDSHWEFGLLAEWGRRKDRTWAPWYKQWETEWMRRFVEIRKREVQPLIADNERVLLVEKLALREGTAPRLTDMELVTITSETKALCMAYRERTDNNGDSAGTSSVSSWGEDVETELLYEFFWRNALRSQNIPRGAPAPKPGDFSLTPRASESQVRQYFHDDESEQLFLLRTFYDKQTSGNLENRRPVNEKH